MGINTQLILTIINVLSGSSVIGILIVSLLSRKKTHAETTDLIQKAAGELVKQYRDHNTELITECRELKQEVDALSVEVKENSTCQGLLTEELNMLKREKTLLVARVKELETKLEELEKENARLKQEREAETAVIA